MKVTWLTATSAGCTIREDNINKIYRNPSSTWWSLRSYTAAHTERGDRVFCWPSILGGGKEHSGPSSPWWHVRYRVHEKSRPASNPPRFIVLHNLLCVCVCACCDVSTLNLYCVPCPFPLSLSQCLALPAITSKCLLLAFLVSRFRGLTTTSWDIAISIISQVIKKHMLIYSCCLICKCLIHNHQPWEFVRISIAPHSQTC